MMASIIVADASSSKVRSEIPRWAGAADALTLALVFFAVVVALTGGFRGELLGLRLSAHSADRALILAALVAMLRHWRLPHPSAFDRLERLSARLPDRFGARVPLADDERRLFGSTSRGWRPRATEFAILVLAYVAIVAAMTYPQIVRLDSVPDLGDPLFSTWRVAWFAHQLPRDPRHLFDGNFFFPEPLTLTYSDSHLAPSLAGAPLLWAGVPQIVVYNLLFLSGFVFSGVCVFLLVHALTGRRSAALVAGAIYAVYPYRFEHYSHLELQMTMWMPLGLLGLHRTFAKGRLRDGLATGAAFALQALSSLYYALFLAFYVMPVAGALALARRAGRRVAIALAAGGALAAAMIAPAAIPYISNRAIGERPIGEVEHYSARPDDYLVAHPRTRLYTDLTAAERRPECELFPTIAPVALALVGAWPPLSAARIGYVGALALAFDGSLGTNGVLFPQLRSALPPYRRLRVPARFSALVGLTLAILAGYGVARLASMQRKEMRLLVVAVALGAVLLEARPRIELEPVWLEPPKFYADLPSDAVLVELPLPRPDNFGEYWIGAVFMYMSTFHWRRLVNGNSGFYPESHLELLKAMEVFPTDSAIAYLRRRGVGYLTVHGRFYPQEEYWRLVARLDSRAELSLVAATPFERSESRLYRIKPPTDAASSSRFLRMSDRPLHGDGPRGESKRWRTH